MIKFNDSRLEVLSNKITQFANELRSLNSELASQDPPKPDGKFSPVPIYRPITGGPELVIVHKHQHQHRDRLSRRGEINTCVGFDANGQPFHVELRTAHLIKVREVESPWSQPQPDSNSPSDSSSESTSLNSSNR